MTDCIVIGGGVIGMLTARELALNGVQVSLFDRGLLGQECSWAGGGILSPLYPWQVPAAITELACWSQTQYSSLCDSLQSDTGIDPEWIQSGMLAFDPEQADQALVWAEQHGNSVLSVTREELIQLEPALQQYPGVAFYLPDVAQVRNPRLIAALKQNLLQLNVELFESTEVTELIITQGKVQGINTAVGKHKAKNTVIACGAWSSQMVCGLPVYPVKGQMLCYKTTPGYLQHILLHDGNYIIPRKDGTLLAGSTLEEVGFNKGSTEQARQHLQHVLQSFLPELSDMQFIDQWSGLRPCTPSGLPFIGAHTDIEGLFLNTGHYRNGLLLAPGSARLLADTFLHRQSFMAIESFRLSTTKQYQTS